MEEEAEEAWLVTTMPDGQRRDTSLELVILLPWLLARQVADRIGLPIRSFQ